MSYDSIVQALLSSHFKFAFLDLYRCIELLYQVIYIDDAHKKLSLTINRTEFLNAIDDKLGWKPNERNAIKKIFIETIDPYKNELQKSIKEIDNQISSFSDWLYDLRCSIVHLKSAQKKFELTHSQWDKLISGMTRLLFYWYQKYQTFD